MRKTVLLFMAVLAAGIATAQMARQSLASPPVLTSPGRAELWQAEPQKASWDGPQRWVKDHSGARTTTGGGRWYNYNYEFLNLYQQSFSNGMNYIGPVMWNDTTDLIGYTGTVSGIYAPYKFGSWKSIGAGLDPMWSYWNGASSGSTSTYPLDYTGEIGVTPTNAYTVDSIEVVGWYTRSTINTIAKDSVHDTLIVTFVQGDGTSTSDLPVNTMTGTVIPFYCGSCTSMNYIGMYHDTVRNRAAHNGGGMVTTVYKFILTKDDSNALAPKNAIFPRPGHWPPDPAISFPVTAGSYVAASVTFKSGDTSYHPRGGHPGDTIRYSDGTSITGTKYSHWEPQVNYAVTTGTNSMYPPYDPTNHANSYFDFEGQNGGWPANPAKYYPNWNIITTLGPPPTSNAAQYPRIAYHIVCPTCPILPFPPLSVNSSDAVNNIVASPNPANDQLVITWNSPKPLTVDVTLTNMIGQTVTSQTCTGSKAIINTTALPAGVYVYAVEANGQKWTGRVAVTH